MIMINAAYIWGHLNLFGSLKFSKFICTENLSAHNIQSLKKRLSSIVNVTPSKNPNSLFKTHKGFMTSSHSEINLQSHFAFKIVEQNDIYEVFGGLHSAFANLSVQQGFVKG